MASDVEIPPASHPPPSLGTMWDDTASSWLALGAPAHKSSIWPQSTVYKPTVELVFTSASPSSIHRAPHVRRSPLTCLPNSNQHIAICYTPFYLFVYCWLVIRGAKHYLVASFANGDVGLNFECVGRWIGERLISPFVSPTLMPPSLPSFVHLMSDGPSLIRLPDSFQHIAICYTPFYVYCWFDIWVVKCRNFAYRDVSLNSGCVGREIGWVLEFFSPLLRVYFIFDTMPTMVFLPVCYAARHFTSLCEVGRNCSLGKASNYSGYDGLIFGFVECWKSLVGLDWVLGLYLGICDGLLPGFYVGDCLGFSSIPKGITVMELFSASLQRLQ